MNLLVLCGNDHTHGVPSLELDELAWCSDEFDFHVDGDTITAALLVDDNIREDIDGDIFLGVCCRQYSEFRKDHQDEEDESDDGDDRAGRGRFR